MDVQNFTAWPVVCLVLGGIAWLLVWIGGMRAFHKTTEENIKKIFDVLDKIREDINRGLFGQISKTDAGDSPRALTELGIDISVKLKTKDWAEKQIGEVASRVEDKKPYKIEKFCFDYAVDNYDFPEDQLTMIEDVAYNRGITVVEVKRVFAIELRDALLARYGFPVPENRPALDD